MKVLNILSQIEMTGAEAYAVTLSDWLMAHDHTVSIISNKLHLPTKAKFIARDIHGSGLIKRIRNIFFVRQFIKSQKIQIVHCHSRAAVRVAYWATWGLPVAMISTVHGRQHSSFSKKIFDLYGDRVIGVCQNVLKSLQIDFKMSARKMVCIGNPVRTDAFVFCQNLASQYKLAIIARPSGPKGQRTRDLIHQTIPVLLQKFPNLQIEIIGIPPDTADSATTQFIESLNKQFAQRLHLLGYMTDLQARLKDYSLIIGSGRVSIESLLQGIPTFALGENSSQGLVQLQNYDTIKETNFGDIGYREVESAFDYQKITQQLVQVLSSSPLSHEEREQLAQRAHQDFSLDKVARKILKIYQSTYFYKLRPQHLPVLMYHKIPDHEIKGIHRIFVTKNNFERHLQYLQKHGFTTISFKELQEYRTGERDIKNFPVKPIIITFDDGYEDNLINAGPLLLKYNMKATLFLLANHQIRSNEWDKGSGDPEHKLMSLEQKRALLQHNFEIGSHGFNHQKITSMSDQEALYELRESKKILENDLSTQVCVFAYTYGVTSAKAAELAEEAGYDFAVNTDTGGLHLEENPYAIFRTTIFPEDLEPQLRKKTASWYRRYFYLKRKK